MTDEEDALRELIRQAHECMKDMRDCVREGKAVVADIEKAANVAVTTRVHEAVRTGLDEYQSTIKNAIEEATDAVYRRFDTIAELLMRGSKKQRREGSVDIEKFAQERAEG